MASTGQIDAQAVHPEQSSRRSILIMIKITPIYKSVDLESSIAALR